MERIWNIADPTVMLRASAVSAADLVRLGPDLGLARGRAHEIHGPARRALAAFAAARMSGPVVWIQGGRVSERLMGDGLAAFLEPARLVLAAGRGPAESLWAAEEALRAGAAPLVVLDLPAPPGLVAVRRLHLGAEAGGERGPAPLALLLLPDFGGAPGVETRWSVEPAPGWAGGAGPRWRLARRRARLAPPAAWEMRLGGEGLALDPLPAALPARAEAAAAR